MLKIVCKGGGWRMSEFGEKILRLYRKLTYSEKGASAVEYAILISLIAVVISVSVAALGSSVESSFERMTAGIGSGASETTAPPAGNHEWDDHWNNGGNDDENDHYWNDHEGYWEHNNHSHHH
jgi:pilus assembly protein Flp/PilA